jgi:hypothetical protein
MLHLPDKRNTGTEHARNAMLRSIALMLLIAATVSICPSQTIARPRAGRDAYLFQASWNNRARTFVGLMQLGLHVNDVRWFAGMVQLGLWGNSIRRRFIGILQIAPLNDAYRLYTIAQIGGLNHNRRLAVGLFQFGLHNQQKKSGFLIQTGIWNENRRSAYSLLQVGILNCKGRGGQQGTLAQVGIVNTSQSDIGVLQLAAFNHVRKTFVGLQIGGVNHSDEVGGAQIGLGNYIGGEIAGLQLGVANFARTVYGMQLGLFNYARRLEGIQIGLLNFSRIGGLPFMVLANAGF